MHDYKYRALAKAPLPAWGWELNDFRTKCLRPIAEAFQWNLIRSSTFALLPSWIALEALREQLWLDYAATKSGHSINPDLFEFRLQASSQVAADEFNRLVETYRKLPDEQHRELLDSIGISYIEYRLKIRDQRAVPTAIEALLATVIIDSWAAFENLVSDLWVTAVDKGPSEVASRVSLSKQLQKPDDHITPATVHKLEHDPRTQLGSWLRETGRVSFQKLDYIRVYYGEAFGKDVRTLFDEVEGGYIVALAAFRNALIHNAGKADAQFVNQVARFPEFRSINVKDAIVLDGEIVKRLRNAGMYLGQKLIQFVDKVLTPA
jgi:hypothetical protein